jgi:hypothetical protein
MKLELKHLAPYLPYGLKIQGTTHGEIAELSCCTETSVNITDRGFAYGMWADIFEIKPILRPLSDLATNDDVFDLLYEECQGIDENIDYWCEFEGDMFNTSISFRASQILIKNHFDVFGLIPTGLAININTL